MTDRYQTSFESISGLDLAEIKTLIDLKGIRRDELRRVLDSKGVDTLEELDPLTARNLLHYLRSL